MSGDPRPSRLESFGLQSAEALRAIATPRVAYVGAWALGAFLGFITIVLLSRTGTNALSLAALIAAVLGVPVFTALSKTRGGAAAISWYFIGLLSGLLLFLILAVTNQLPKLDSILNAGPTGSPAPGPSEAVPTSS